MNIDNLQKAYDHMQTVSSAQFDMGFYRMPGQARFHECKSVGCIIGHCTALVPFEELPILKTRFGRSMAGDIDFTAWSEDFFGIDHDSDVWEFLFDGEWGDSDEVGTLEQALKRMEYVLENMAVPDDWNSDDYEYEME